MRKRDMNLEKIKANAESFGVTPALIWLMDAKSRWGWLEEGIRQINKGMALTRSDLSIDKLRDDLLVLAALLDEQ